MVEIPGMDMLEVHYCNGRLAPFLSPGLHIGEVSCKLAVLSNDRSSGHYGFTTPVGVGELLYGC
jgi:hypothetical protein